MKWITALPRWIFLGMALPLVVLNGWVIVLLLQYFRSVVTIFVGAAILSFALDYPVRWLQRYRMLRFHAVILVFLIAVSFFLLLAVTIVPIVFVQFNELVTRFPLWLESGNHQFQAIQTWTLARRLPVDFSKLASWVESSLPGQLQNFSSNVLSFSLGLLGSALDFSLAIAVTFYLLLYGDRFWDGIFQWFPSPWQRELRQSFRQNFHNYFIGQSTLACLMGLSMVVAFLVLQVPFGLLFGLGIGLMTLFPFGAVLSIWSISFLIALGNIWLGAKVLVIALLIDQSIESGIAPRLLGRFTGLNPVWILLVLLVGVRMGGLLGLLLAVPTAGFIKNTFDIILSPPIDSHG